MYMLSVILGIIILILLCAWQTCVDAPVETSFKGAKELDEIVEQYDAANKQFKTAISILVFLFVLSLLLNFA